MDCLDLAFSLSPPLAERLRAGFQVVVFRLERHDIFQVLVHHGDTQGRTVDNPFHDLSNAVDTGLAIVDELFDVDPNRVSVVVFGYLVIEQIQ